MRNRAMLTAYVNIACPLPAVSVALQTDLLISTLIVGMSSIQCLSAQYCKELKENTMA